MTSTQLLTRGRSPSRPTALALYYLVALGVAVILVGPLLVAVLRSLQSGTGVVEPVGLDMLSTMSLDNYSELLRPDGGILPYLGNSTLVAAGAALVATFSGGLAGYVFARFRFRGVNVLFVCVLAIFMVPFQAVVIPLLSMLDRLQLSDTHTGLILVHATYALPFCMFVMRNTFLEIPIELEEAARMDGASWWQTLVRVLRPVIVPGLVSSALFAFLFSWTEFLGAVTFLSSQRLFTLPVQLLNLQLGTQGIVNYGFLESGAVITMVPCLILYLLLQRYYVAGLISGSVKG